MTVRELILGVSELKTDWDIVVILLLWESVIVLFGVFLFGV